MERSYKNTALLKIGFNDTRAFVSCPKVGGQELLIMGEVGGKNQKFIASITDFGQNSAKVEGQLPPPPSRG